MSSCAHLAASSSAPAAKARSASANRWSAHSARPSIKKACDSIGAVRRTRRYQQAAGIADLRRLVRDSGCTRVRHRLLAVAERQARRAALSQNG
jgi:hypothetical protein